MNTTHYKGALLPNKILEKAMEAFNDVSIGTFSLISVSLLILVIYTIQYPASLALGLDFIEDFSLDDLIYAYFFVTFSALLLILSVLAGLKTIDVFFPETKRRFQAPMFVAERTNTLTLLVLLLLFAWSAVMLNFRVGITIYFEQTNLPFKIAGLLFYGRLIVQPVLVAFIAEKSRNSPQRSLIFLLIFLLGIWVSMTSGSRFLAILFAIAASFAFKGWKRPTSALLICATYIVAAYISRVTLLPATIGGETQLVYGNPLAVSSAFDNVILSNILYVVLRTMGIQEVIMTMSFGEITPSLLDSIKRTVSYFIPYINIGETASVKNIYGLDDSVFGGYGLDLLSNYWFYMGGRWATYAFGLVLLSFFLGALIKLTSNFLIFFSFPNGAYLSFAIFFLLFYNGSAFLFMPLLAAVLILYVFSTKLLPSVSGGWSVK